MNNGFQPLNDDEVLYVNVGRVLMSNPTFKVGEFLDALAQAVHDFERDWIEENEGWFTDGLECEALRLQNQGWQRGRVRLRLEFCPDETRPKLLDMPRRTTERRRPASADTPVDPRLSEPYRPPERESRFDDIYNDTDDTY